MKLFIQHIPANFNILVGTGLPPCTPVRIYHPTQFTETVLAGSKEEHGPGGFEVLCYPTGPYRVDALQATFNFTPQPGRTNLRFEPGDEPPPEPTPDPAPSPELQQMVADLGEGLHSLGLAHELALEVYERMVQYVSSGK